MKYGTWKEYINTLKNNWIGKIIEYEGKNYNVIDIDYNGMLLINKKALYTDTTAISISNINVL